MLIEPSERSIARRVPRTARLAGFFLLPALLAPAGPSAARASGQRASDASGHGEVQVLEIGRTFDGEVSGDRSRFYEVTLAAGQYVDVVWEYRGSYPLLSRLLGPNGERLLEHNAAETEGRDGMSWIADEPGHYRLQIAPVAPDMPPALYAVRLAALREATPDDRIRIRADRLIRTAHGLSRGTEASKRQAVGAFEESLGLWRAVGDVPMETDTLLWLGAAYLRLAEYTKSLKAYHDGLLLTQSAKDLQKEGIALNNIGTVYGVRQEWEKALEYWTRAVAARRAAGNPADDVQTVNNIAGAHQHLGDPQRALDSFFQGLQVARQKHDRYSEAVLLNNIGRLYGSMGDDVRASEYFSQALPAHRTANDEDGEAMAIVGLGEAYSNLGEAEKALETLDQALALVRRRGNRRVEAVALRAIARIRYAQGETRKALEAAQEALSSSVALGDRLSQAQDLNQVGEAFATLGEWEKAMAHLQQALALFRESGNRRAEVRTLYELGRVERGRGRLAEARAHVEVALRHIEAFRTKLTSPTLRTSYFALVEQNYELYIDLLMRLHSQEPGAGLDVLAFEASERARARTLLELLGETPSEIREGVDPQLLDQEKRLQRRLSAKTDLQMRLLAGASRPAELAEVGRDIELLAAELDQIDVQIRQKSPRYAALTQPHPLGLREIQTDALDADTVLLQYALGEERSFLWVVTQASLASHELPGRADIEGLVRRAREAVSTRPGAAASPAARELAALARVVLGPARSQLEGKRLLIVADDALQYVPFAALSVDEAGAPLVVDHEIVTLPSASVLSLLRRERKERRPPAKTLAVFADPVFEKDDERVRHARAVVPAKRRELSDRERSVASAVREAGVLPGSMRLPFTGREANAILALVPPHQRKAALGFEATRTAATSADLADYRFVHFATHGFVNGRRPELSGVMLSLVDPSGQQRDGFLSAADIFNLRLSAELVVLSGCRTALGKEIRGEGLVGLTRAFMYAGAGDVVASLWNIDDAATAELMRRFYQGMLGPRRLSPAAALRAAQRGMWESRRWRAPYYWSGFVIQGDWR